jgi:hypothetical protein
MDTIRGRIASKRHLLDSFPGLSWKAWLLSEPTPHFAQPKSYAPVYLFHDEHATVSFLRSDLYKGVTDSFGWTKPLVGPAITASSDEVLAASVCTVRTDDLPSHAALIGHLADPQAECGAALVLRQLDIARMQVRTYRFWRSLQEALGHPEVASIERAYEVVAVSTPSLISA